MIFSQSRKLLLYVPYKWCGRWDLNPHAKANGSKPFMYAIPSRPHIVGLDACKPLNCQIDDANQESGFGFGASALPSTQVISLV